MLSKTGSGLRRAGRGLFAAALLSVALGVSAAPSSADAPIRGYATQIQLNDPEAVTVAPGDEVLIAELPNGVIHNYSPYPAHAELGTEPGHGFWGGNTLVHSVAKSGANDFIYVGTEGVELPGGGSCNGNPFVTLDNFGNVLSSFMPSCQSWVAVDNAPQTDDYGNYYLYANGQIEKFDGYGNPETFTGSAGYINGNKITGTPFSELSNSNFNPDMAGVTVDTEGNIWAVNQDHRELDEFDPSGVFLQRITEKSSGVPQFTNPTGPHGFSAYPGITGVAVDPTNGDVLTSDKTSGVVVEFSPQGQYVGYLDGSGTTAGKFKFQCEGEPGNEYCHDHVVGVAVNSEGYVYVTDGLNNVVDVFDPRPAEPTITNEPSTNPTTTGGRVNALIDPNGGGSVTGCKVEYGPKIGEYTLGTLPCSPDPSGGNFTSPTEVHADISGLTSETTYHYRWAVENANSTRIGPDRTFTPHIVLGLRADPADAVTSSSATLHGSFVGNGAATKYWFEYGPTTAYGTKTPLPAPPGGNAGAPAGPGLTSLEAAITGLKPVTRYHYRVVAENGSVSNSEDQSFHTLPLLPQVKEFITSVHSNQVLLHTDINPGGADTTFTFEYGTEPCSEVPDPCTTAFPQTHIGSNLEVHPGNKELEGLQAETTYYYRVLATNSQGTTPGPDRTFSTYQFSTELTDPCPNSLARQQTGAALVTDCRGYELVSSPHAGGYDVESNLVPGQEPFDGHPSASDPLRVLYGIHNGAIPGVPGNPPNRGVDPYIATRGSEGWTTSYVGISASDPFATAPFSSTVAGTDASLNVFAFDGPDLCSPCFEGNSTGIPLHLANGELVQGMQGSVEPPAPATSDGLVKKHLSADGSHFIFSTTTKLEAGGNDSTGDVSIYDRDLATGVTQVVSTDSSGNPLACPQGAGTCHGPGNGDGIAELDVSTDGSRILTGQKISTDTKGNDYFHLYMHVGNSPDSVDITPGAVEGALYDGMTADGSAVFFTTKDHLLGSDSDASADIYEAAVSGPGTATLRLVSTDGGNPVNDDSCTPPGEPTSWNAASGSGKCNAVAFAGGAGVASESNTIYFLSPELLDSPAEADGEAGEPNVYVSKQGSAPEFVATIDSSAVKPPAAPHVHAAGKSNFRNGLERPEDIAVDQNSGDVYVAEAEAGQVSRWTAAGKAHNFSAIGGTNKLTGFEFGSGEGQIAVDSSNSPLKGDLYATTNSGEVLKVFSETGASLGEINVGGETCGVAVDQSNGDVYAGIYGEEIKRFRPLPGATTPITNADYQEVEGAVFANGNCNIDVSAEGHVYTWPYSGGPISQLSTSAFGPAPFATATDTPFGGEGTQVESDPSNGDVYVDKGNKVARYSSSGTELESFGALGGGSHGIGVNGANGKVYASDGGSVIEFSYPPPYEPIDNPAVVHAVSQAGSHDWSDFQVSPTGEFAAFTTRLQLDDGFENLGHSEVYRYDDSNKALDCVSCPPTNALATGDATLGSNGLSLADDGRVFFDTEEGIVLRDGDETKDVYEWEKEGTGPKVGGCAPGNPNLFPTGICLSLISTGTSQFDSSLLTATADGSDAFFFTHDTLAKNDDNGPITKIYDARTEGGIFNIPPPALCAASDECHGPGTRASETPPIRTIAGTPGNGGKKATCKTGFVKKHGKCVQKKKKAHHRKHKRHHHRRAR